MISWSNVCKLNNSLKYKLYFMLHSKNKKYFDKFIVTQLSSSIEHNTLDIRKLKTSLEVLVCNYKLTNYTLSKLIHLRFLDLASNTKISDNTLKKMIYLRHLNIGRNYNISDYSIKYLVNLTYLNCGIMNIQFTDEGIQPLINLITLYTSYIDITDNAFKTLTKLKHLYCDYNSKLTNHIFNYLPQLTELSVGYNKFSIQAISKLSNLTHLTINPDMLIFNEYFSCLQKLIYLNCSYNNTISDEALLYLPNLKYLKRCNNQFTDIGLCTLRQLIYLDCGINNKFTNNGFCHLTKLQVLICGKNRNIKKSTILYFPNLSYISY